MNDDSVDRVERDHNKVINHFFHDFHGEISTIEMCIGAVRDGVGGSVAEAQRLCLERAIENCEHMVRLIKNFRDRTQMEEGSYPRIREKVDVARMMDQLAQVGGSAATSRKLRLQVQGEGLPVAYFRAQLLWRALENLLLQVVDNTCAMGSVHVQASVAESQLRVVMRFEGEELDRAAGSTVFDPVQQATVGLRLGRGYTMLFCKEAVAYMGGDIHLAPWTGHGNEVVVRVPFDAAGNDDT